MERRAFANRDGVSVYSISATKESVHGPIRSEEECLKIIDMCRTGALQRVTSRLSEEERKAIRPGSIYVYEEDESGISRWTDGKMWSSSKVHGRCLIYYEIVSTEQLEMQKAISAQLDTIPDILRIGREIIQRKSDSTKCAQRFSSGLIKMSTSLSYQGKVFHLVSYTTTAYMQKSTRRPIWKMILAWEVPRNFHLRMSYRKKRASLQDIDCLSREIRRVKSCPDICAPPLKEITNTLDLPDAIEKCVPDAACLLSSPQYPEEEQFLRDYLQNNLHWESDTFLL